MTYWEIIADSLEKTGWSLGQGLSHFCFFFNAKTPKLLLLVLSNG